jgi:glucose uptake protein GlcU
MTSKQILGMAIIFTSACLLIFITQELYQIYQAQSQLDVISGIWADFSPRFIKGFGIDDAIKDQKAYHTVIGIISLICLLIGIALASSTKTDNGYN